MSPQEYEELIALLDGRIDELTKPLPSKQILRFAEALQSVDLEDDELAGTYGEEDYSNLLLAQSIVNETLPRILESLRAASVKDASSWRFQSATAGQGDAGLCALCREPYQHFNHTVAIHCLDMHPNAFHGVCRDCVRQYAPLDFVEHEDVALWLERNPDVTERLEDDEKREGQRVDLIDAIRRHAHSTHYFSDIVQQVASWAKAAYGEWR